MNKSFEVRREELRGSLMTAPIYKDGECIEEADEVELRTLTTGFSVYEYGENGMTERVVFYPVKIDTEAWTTNEDEVLNTIQEDYRAELGWENYNW